MIERLLEGRPLVIAIVQCRLGSSRFPRKALADLCGKPIIRHVVERALQIRGVDRVIVAVPSMTDMMQIAPALPDDERLSVFCAAGDENDVLRRFVLALENYPTCDVVMRLTGDCPLIQPEVCERVLALHSSTGRLGYAWTNTHSGDWPDGLDCEVFDRVYLDQAHEDAKGPDREHVTPMIRRYCFVSELPPDPAYSGWPKVSIDTEEDLERVRQMMEASACLT